MFNRRTLIAAVAAAAVLFGAPVSAQDKSIVVSSTTSTQDSGLFAYIPAVVQAEDRNRRESHRAGHWPGARHWPPRRC